MSTVYFRLSQLGRGSMSEWDGGTYDPSKKKTTNKKQEVVPHVCVTNPDFGPMLERMVSTQQSISFSVPTSVSRILPDSLRHLDSYYEVKWRDCSIAFAELRFDKGHGEKSFRELFQADVSGSDKAEHNSLGTYSTRIEALAKVGLLIPANVPGMWAALDEARRSNLTLGVVLCEGIKAMRAMEGKLSTPEARQRAAQSGYYMVASAWVGGAYGAQSTNFAVRPTARCTWSRTRTTSHSR
jgi:hypothetical protein